MDFQESKYFLISHVCPLRLMHAFQVWVCVCIGGYYSPSLLFLSVYLFLLVKILERQCLIGPAPPTELSRSGVIRKV